MRRIGSYTPESSLHFPTPVNVPYCMHGDTVCGHEPWCGTSAPGEAARPEGNQKIFVPCELSLKRKGGLQLFLLTKPKLESLGLYVLVVNSVRKERKPLRKSSAAFLQTEHLAEAIHCPPPPTSQISACHLRAGSDGRGTGPQGGRQP